MNSSLKQCLSIVYIFGGILSLCSIRYNERRFATKRGRLTLLEIFFAPHKAKARLRVHVTLDVQLTAQNLGTAEEDAHLT
jgi:hypothetical protein